ncbi:homoserine O-acetyltransferase [Variibacter gotjawalensis]|uniref:Homoserine O-acetyltransferase n=1 Tax=Variibacter gotjawalensis TaxID=1333996 RepID=A0A0S3PRE6_9BRAD|nr:alpha/beta fold hydrolase [Variibacter gotjawalensis]NIK48790.1 homoserine O-acetyltransferase [Variibacter gotjawalensis]RZS50651.1 homoserine O-acetyltransferase [Variibacter gotjawalensis]BAT58484.1 homoserine O-acetyltransferase [Variibacter gotjawalensis]
MHRLAAALGAATLALMTIIPDAEAQNYPAPKSAAHVLRDFKFHTGETLPELTMAYVTIGEPSGQPVLVLHGSGGSAQNMLTPAFAGQMFGPGQPLDAQKYFIIIPDSVGHGKSSKPSDGMKTRFPRYNYADMVSAQHRLVTEGLGLKRLRLIIGNSMGGMHAWLWATQHPNSADAIVPMASQPTAMAARNWILRRMMIETIRNDPEYQDGNYTAQPRMMKYAIAAYGLASAGGTLAYQSQAPTAKAADDLVDARLKAALPVDANDFLYAWGSSQDYDASAGMEKITAAILVVNAADDERNPPETGLTEAAVKRIKNAKLLVIPPSAETTGHLTTGNAKWYADALAELLAKTPAKGM